MDYKTIMIDYVVPTLTVVVMALMPVLLKLVMAWLRAKLEQYTKTEVEKKAIAALMEGVEKASEEFVVIMKSASEDGKLSVEERATARNIAITHAKKIATGDAGRLLAAASAEKLGAWIRAIVAQRAK